MCWLGKCDIKIAKRDFYVYKLGSVSYKGFEDGAKWAIEQFLKSLWHPVSKEPEKFRKILYTGGSIDTTMLIINNSWDTKVCLLKIKKWCYIDDLFQKGGGNYD